MVAGPNPAEGTPLLILGDLFAGLLAKLEWNSTDHRTLKVAADGFFAQGNIVNTEGEPFTARYHSLRHFAGYPATKLRSRAERKKTLNLASDGKISWTCNSNLLPDLNEAIDVDLSATPFTNTLPIRRLQLK